MTTNPTTRKTKPVALLGFFPPVWLAGIVILFPLWLLWGLFCLVVSKALGFMDIVDDDLSDYLSSFKYVLLWPWAAYKGLLWQPAS